MPVTLFSMPTPTSPFQAMMGGADAATGLQQKMIQNAYLPYQDQADIGMKLVQTQLMPMQTAAAYNRGMGILFGANNGYVGNYLKMLNTPQGQAMLARNPGLAQQMASLMRSQSSLAPAIAGSPLGSGVGIPNVSNAYNSLPNNGMFSLIKGGNAPAPAASPATAATPTGIGAVAAARPPLQVGVTNTTPTNTAALPTLPLTAQQQQRLQNDFNVGAPTSADSNDDASTVQNATGSAFISKNQPKKVQPLNYAGARAQTSLQNATNLFDVKDQNTGEQIGASRYIGPMGRLNYLEDMWKAHQTGITPQSLINWNNFNSALENTKVQAAQLEGVPADQISRSSFGTVFDVNPWTDTPQMVASRLQNASNMMKNAEMVNRSDVNQVENNPEGLANAALKTPNQAAPTPASSLSPKGMPSQSTLVAELKKRGYKI
jgi:hypothetical protein